jgi:hypothetical protein
MQCKPQNHDEKERFAVVCEPLYNCALQALRGFIELLNTHNDSLASMPSEELLPANEHYSVVVGQLPPRKVFSSERPRNTREANSVLGLLNGR